MIVVSNTFPVQVNAALTRVVSNTFSVQVQNSLREIVSNTYSATIEVPEGKQVIELTALSSESPLFGVASIGDEWLLDLVTDTGLSINPIFNGTYTIDNLAGNGRQEFAYNFLDVSNAYTLSITEIEYVDALANQEIISNTFQPTVQPPIGMGVVELTSVVIGSPVEGQLTIGDEWAYDLLTDGDISITALPDGSYTHADTSGLGTQTFNWFGIDESNSYARTSNRVETILDPSTLPYVPVITTQPSNETLNEGAGFITFSVEANGRPEPTYQWRRNGISISGATSNSLDVYGVSVDITNDGDVYDVQVSNNQGTVISSQAILTVIELAKAPVITLHPVDQTLQEGSGSVTYTCAATALNAISYQWEVFNGAQFVDLLGETSPSITINGNTVTHALNNGNGYRCQISNSEGTVYTDLAALFVTPLTDEAPDATLTASDIDDSSFNVRFTADEAGVFNMIVVTNNSPIPTVQEVRTATAAGILYVSPTAIMDVGVEVVTPVYGLDVFTSYDVYAVLVDSEGNERLLDKLDVSTTRDSTPPVIVLRGSSTIRIPFGQSYSEQGAVVVDNVDPDKEANVSGAVSVGNLGTYTRTYTGSDIEGNVATPVTRTVIVYDPTLVDDDGGVITTVVDENIDDVIDEVIE